jgi:hypothetical protein
MKRILLLFALLAGLVSCQFFPGQGEKRPAPTTEPEATTPSSAPDGTGTEAGENDAMEVLGKILGGLEKLAQKAIDKGWIDTTHVEDAPVVEEEPEPEPEVPAAAEDEWYDHDFALRFTYHQYVGAVRSASNDFSMYYTRIGNKVYVHMPGERRQDTVLEFHDDGTRTAKRYLVGVLIETNKKEGTAHKYLHYQFTDVGNTFNEILGRHPDISKAQSETTISGRRVAVIHTEKDEMILTQKLHTEKDYYVDKEYGFLYKTVGNGSGGGMTIKNGCTWEVTYFTDKPTQKDIHLKITDIPKQS